MDFFVILHFACSDCRKVTLAVLHKGFESEKVRKKGLLKVLKKVNVLKQASDSRKVT